MSNYKHHNLIKIAKKHKESRDDSIEQFMKKHTEEITPERILHIISFDASHLIQEIHSHRISSYEATLAYCLRAATEGRKNNWITEEMFEDALQKAKVVDMKISKKEKLATLEGLPVSVKDNYLINKKMTTIGLCNFLVEKNEDGNLKYLANDDSYLIKILREKGAIIYVKTNTPQNMISVESTNNLWGASKNPWDSTRTCGGSSGGEAGLIGGLCSPLGFGGDIGGSIRIPSTFCGIYGFKPTSNRFTKKNTISTSGKKFSANLSIVSSNGPMGRSADDILLVSRLLFGSFKEDFYSNYAQFNETLYNSIDPKVKKIKIGIIKRMNYCETAPEIIESIEKIKKELLLKGFDCEEISNDFQHLINIAKNILVNSGTSDILVKTLGNENPMNYYSNYLKARNLPNFLLNSLSAWHHFRGNHKLGNTLDSVLRVKQETLFESILKLQEMKTDFIDNLRLQGFDAFIAPVMPFYAGKIGTGEHLVNYIDFTYLFNILDMPSVSIPLKLSEKEEYIPYPYDNCQQFLKNNVIKGMPVSVQVISFPNRDEVCLKMMKEIDDIFRFDKNFMPKILEKQKN